MAETPSLFNQNSFTTEVDHGEGYQRLSRLAVWSIPLGLLSALAMISPLLWFIPALAIAFAVGGLWAISRSDDTTGRRLAIIGLGFAVLFGSWGMSWTISRRMMINRQAKMYASEWLGRMKAKEFMKAHQLTINYFDRLPEGSSLHKHYGVQDPSEETAIAETPSMMPAEEQSPSEVLHEFKTNGMTKELVDANGAFEFEFVRNLAVLRGAQASTKVFQEFRLTFAQDDPPRELDVQIEMKRTVENNRAHWQVARITQADGPG